MPQINGEEIFTSGVLASGLRYTVVDGKGRHYFRAIMDLNAAKLKAQEQGKVIDDFLPFLMAKLIYLNGKPTTADELMELDVADVAALFQIVGTQLEKFTL